MERIESNELLSQWWFPTLDTPSLCAHLLATHASTYDEKHVEHKNIIKFEMSVYFTLAYRPGFAREYTDMEHF